MVHQSRRPIANGCVVGSKSTIGLIRGETAVLVVGGQHSGVVGVARGIPDRRDRRGHSYLRFIICSHSRVPSF